MGSTPSGIGSGGDPLTGVDANAAGGGCSTVPAVVRAVCDGPAGVPRGEGRFPGEPCIHPLRLATLMASDSHAADPGLGGELRGDSLSEAEEDSGS